MNIVFWLIVVIVLVLIWFCLSFAFKGVGGVGMRYHITNVAADSYTLD